MLTAKAITHHALHTIRITRRYSATPAGEIMYDLLTHELAGLPVRYCNPHMFPNPPLVGIYNRALAATVLDDICSKCHVTMTIDDRGVLCFRCPRAEHALRAAPLHVDADG